MVLHATVQKLTTWKALLSLSAPLSSEMPLFTEGRVTEDSNKRSKRCHPYGSPPRLRTQSRLTYCGINLSTSSVLPQATPVPGYATDTHSLLNMGP